MTAAPYRGGVAVLWSALGYLHFDKYPNTSKRALIYAREYEPIDPGNPEELFALQYYGWHRDDSGDIVVAPAYGVHGSVELDPDTFEKLNDMQ